MLSRQGEDRPKVAVALSGGVDSAVAAALLKKEGYQVIGLTMKTWRGGEAPATRHHACYGPGEEKAIDQAQRVAKRLQIPLYVFDLSEEYEAEVLNYFRREYQRGRTPNPCVKCNKQLKFKILLEKARSQGVEFEHFASGHYARVEYNPDTNRYILKTARDKAKDQSYFLFALSQEQLGHLLLPLGDYFKSEVREMARVFELPVELTESQDFAEGGYLWLFDELRPGPVLDGEGNLLGMHRGLPSYTIGQRRGLGIAAGKPLYVTRIDPERNALIVGSRDEIYSRGLIASGVNWIAMERLEQPLRARVKIRYKHEGAEALLIPLEDDGVRVEFDRPQPAVTPGQAAVFYQGEVVLGGGMIEGTLEA